MNHTVQYIYRCMCSSGYKSRKIPRSPTAQRIKINHPNYRCTLYIAIVGKKLGLHTQEAKENGYWLSNMHKDMIFRNRL